MTTIEHRVSVFFFTHSTLRNKNKGEKKKPLSWYNEIYWAPHLNSRSHPQMPLNRLIQVNPASSYNESYGAPPSLIRNGDRKNASTAMSPWNAADRSSWWRSHVLPSISQLCTGQSATFTHYCPHWGHPGAELWFLVPLIGPEGVASLNIDMKLQLLSGFYHNQSPFYWADSAPASVGRKILCSAAKVPPHKTLKIDLFGCC